MADLRQRHKGSGAQDHSIAAAKTSRSRYALFCSRLGLILFNAEPESVNLVLNGIGNSETENDIGIQTWDWN